jgi:2-polyprenyl-6-methoxyphenol hydroxylase-like FAD-dependent oxidoreductase
MGDAEHAVSPVLGMGSSMALEDAKVLAQELKNNKENIPAALAAYKRRRGGRIRKLYRISGMVEKIMMVKSPLLAFFRDIFIVLIPDSFFTKRIEKILIQKI